MADQKIIDRIKKLLALAKDNVNAAEATAAALKAQKLIAEYDVSKVDLYGEKRDEITEVYNEHNIKNNPWGKRLAWAIADNFRCRWYTHYEGSKSYWTGRTTKTSENVVFMGYETDAQAAKVTYDRLYEIGLKLANRECRLARERYGTAQGVKNSFLLGYVDGIRKELEKQCEALVLVRPKAVDDYANERTRGFAKGSSTVRNAYDNGSYNSGKRAGRDSVRSARLGGQAALTA